MANPEHLNILKQGVETWNQWREEHPEIEPDLQEANLVGTHLEGVPLTGAPLEGARLKQGFSKVELRSVILRYLISESQPGRSWQLTH